MKLTRITESQFLQQILDLAALYGWRSAHFRPGRTRTGWRTACQGNAKGWPDVTLTKDGRLIFWEAKVGNEQPSPEQRAWLTALSLVPGVEARVVRPVDWDHIERTLMGG